jgi:hypothetical protein
LVFRQVTLPTQGFCVNGITDHNTVKEAGTQLAGASLVVVELQQQALLPPAKALSQEG